MKKILSVALIAMMVLSCFSFVTFAEDYDSTWTITTDKESYNAGDYMVLSVKNSTELANKLYPYLIHITFDENILEYVTDADELYDALEVEPETLPGEPAYGTGGEGGTLTKDGEFIDNVAATGSTVRANRVVYNIYFKVRKDIIGVQELNFCWVLNSSDFPSYAGYQLSGDIEKYYYNIEFVDKTVKVVGSELGTESAVLPEAYAYASANDLNTTDINGTSVNITTGYAAAFGKVAPRKADATRTKAGFLLSKANENMTIDNSDLKDFEAINVSSENIFGGLFYGPGLEAGQTYYVMPYVTYSDGVTLYASEAKSFIMPE